MRHGRSTGIHSATVCVGGWGSGCSAPRAVYGLWQGATIVGVVLATFMWFPATAAAADRVALVVGNSEYVHAGRLPNPGNDADAVGESLKRLGFEVTTVLNADMAEMNDALRIFSRQSATADVAAVFYAGHGIEVDGVNYLVPVDAQLERDTDVRFENVTLDMVLEATAGASLRLVVLDACRNNPLARTMQRTARTRSISRGSFGELNEEQLSPGLVVAYAAAAGTTADDGAGRHSPYTRALLQYLEAPAEIIQVFRWVQGTVLEATDGRQQPHLYFSLPGERFLNGNSNANAVPSPSMPSQTVMNRLEEVVDRLNELTDSRPSATAAATPPGPRNTVAGSPGVTAAASGGPPGTVATAPEARLEMVFWESIRDSANPADFAAYLARWPAGVFAPLARTRVAPGEVERPAGEGTVVFDRNAPVDRELTDIQWNAALQRATLYGRPDRTSEGDLDDGSHYEQSSDDRSYQEYCDGRPGRPGIAGFNLSIRGNTKSVHWRWKTRTGAPAPGRSWRTYFSGTALGSLGDRIIRVADTEVAWYQFKPFRQREERPFVLLVACELPGVEEIEVHYHH